jgi:hypothetical protein
MAPLSIIYFPQGGFIGIIPISLADNTRTQSNYKKKYAECHKNKDFNGLYHKFETSAKSYTHTFNDKIKTTCTTEKASAKCLKIAPGSVLVIRQDLPHAGAPYETENLRVFYTAQLKNLDSFGDILPYYVDDAHKLHEKDFIAAGSFISEKSSNIMVMDKDKVKEKRNRQI